MLECIGGEVWLCFKVIEIVVDNSWLLVCVWGVCIVVGDILIFLIVVFVIVFDVIINELIDLVVLLLEICDCYLCIDYCGSYL